MQCHSNKVCISLLFTEIRVGDILLYFLRKIKQADYRVIWHHILMFLSILDFDKIVF